MRFEYITLIVAFKEPLIPHSAANALHGGINQRFLKGVVGA